MHAYIYTYLRVGEAVDGIVNLLPDDLWEGGQSPNEVIERDEEA